jgi:hypothetical protein
VRSPSWFADVDGDPQLLLYGARHGGALAQFIRLCSGYRACRVEALLLLLIGKRVQIMRWSVASI